MDSSQQHNWNLRSATVDDIDGVCDVINAYSMDVLGVGADNRRYVIMTWEQPGFDVEMDTLVAVSHEGRIVGYAEVEDTEEPHVKISSWMRVHPDVRKLGVDTALLSWIEQRSNQSVCKAPKGARVTVAHGTADQDGHMQKLLRDRGFDIVRYFQRMTIELTDDVPAPTWPEGIVSRSFVLENDLEDVVLVIRDTFQDHWGHVDKPFEEELEQWNHRFRGDAEFDETLSSLAMADGTIVGYSLCDYRHPEDPNMGIVAVLGVRREWRRRGIARALLRRSFQQLKARGQQRVCLGVDATSLTGAQRVYEAAGMQPTRQFNVFEKELRAGEELSLQSLDEGENRS